MLKNTARCASAPAKSLRTYLVCKLATSTAASILLDAAMALVDSVSLSQKEGGAA